MILPVGVSVHRTETTYVRPVVDTDEKEEEDRPQVEVEPSRNLAKSKMSKPKSI